MRGLFVSFGGQGLRLAISAGQIVLLSRLLPPETWGVFQMTWAVLALIYNSRDLGIASAVVQRQDVTAGFLNAAFWMNCVSSVGLAALVALLGWPLAFIYREPGAMEVALKFAPMFLLSGVSTHFQAIMRREMHYVRLNVLLTIAQVVGTVGAILLALDGWGIDALIFMLAGQELVLFLLAPFFCHWRPGKPSFRGEWRRLASFGGDISLFRTFQNLAAGMDNIALGLFSNTATVGLYSRAMALFATPRRQVVIPFGQVVPTLLARLQGEPDAFARTTCRLLNTVAYAWFPYLALMAAVPGTALAVAVGPQWADAASLLPILALGELTRLHLLMVNTAEVQLGRARSLRNFGLVSSPLIAGALLLGAWQGLEAMVRAYAVVQVGVFILRLVQISGETPLRFGQVLKSLLNPLLFAVVLWGSFLLGGMLAEAHTAIVRLLAALGAGAVGALLFWLLWPPCREDVRALLRTLQLMRPRT